ncbi:MAG: PPC domain-containing protein, partial [Myxococcales bacterium]|nr:PPC domain-containing protein [Myxococcales bacterium]
AQGEQLLGFQCIMGGMPDGPRCSPDDPPEVACAPACQWFTDCLAGPQCPGVDRPRANELNGACADELCLGQPGIVQDICSLEACDQAIDIAQEFFGDICFGDEPPPMDCADALRYEAVVPSELMIDNALVQNGISGTCAGSANAVVIRLTVPRAMTVTIDIGENSFDTVLSVRRSCDQAGSELACNDDSPDASGSDVASYLVLELAAGQYDVLVHGYSGAQGTALVTIDELPAP